MKRNNYIYRIQFCNAQNPNWRDAFVGDLTSKRGAIQHVCRLKHEAEQFGAYWRFRVIKIETVFETI